MRGRTRSTLTGSTGTTRVCSAIRSRTLSINAGSERKASLVSRVSAIGCNSGTVAASSSSLSIRRALATAASAPASWAVLINSCTRSSAIRSSVAKTVPSCGNGQQEVPVVVEGNGFGGQATMGDARAVQPDHQVTTAHPARPASGPAPAGRPDADRPARWHPDRTARRPPARGSVPRPGPPPSPTASGARPPAPRTTPARARSPYGYGSNGRRCRPHRTGSAPGRAPGPSACEPSVVVAR